jgi:hypothetical protein
VGQTSVCAGLQSRLYAYAKMHPVVEIARHAWSRAEARRWSLDILLGGGRKTQGLPTGLEAERF